MTAVSPILLALDTATERLALALAGPRGDLLCLEEGGARASARLLPALLELLAAAGLQVSDLDAIAFGRGPGAFTGLRTACAAAQGLALGCARPVLPLDSLLIVAEDARLQIGAEGACEIGVAMDARMGEIYAAAYAWQGGRWTTLEEPALWAAPDLAACWQRAPLAVVAGSALSAFAAALPSGSAVRVEQEHNRARALLNLARQAWADGQAVDAALALPLYVRDKVASTTAEREAQRLAATGGGAS